MKRLLSFIRVAFGIQSPSEIETALSALRQAVAKLEQHADKLCDKVSDREDALDAITNKSRERCAVIAAKIREENNEAIVAQRIADLMRSTLYTIGEVPK